MSEIKLGSLVRDRVSKLTGIATCRVSDFTGMIQIGIQPEVTKDKPVDHPDALSFDLPQVEYLGVGESHLTVPHPASYPFKLGDEVVDQLAGTRGILVRTTEYMNGCTIVSIQTKTKKGEKTPDISRASHLTLKRVGPGVTKMLAAKAKASAKAQPELPKKPGGAPQRVERV